MPNRSQFNSNEEYNAYWRKYRFENLEKMRKYGREYNKKWRKIHGYKNEKKWKSKNKWKVAAQKALENAVKTGKILKKPCIICGNKNSLAHHPDYNKQFEVIWLCPFHHKEIHKKLTCA